VYRTHDLYDSVQTHDHWTIRTVHESVKYAYLISTSSGAHAMHGFGAMCLLQSCRYSFLAPQCAALRCPWMSALVLPVVGVPSCARGRPGVLFTAHLHMYNKSIL